MSSKTIVCPHCDGRGVVYKKELVDYHKLIYITNSKDCKRCKCRGVLIQTTKVTIRALKPSEFKLHRNHNG